MDNSAQPYRIGQQDLLGALGLVLNMIVLWNTVYFVAVFNELRHQELGIAEYDIAKLAPPVDQHLNVHGRYTWG